MNESVQEVSQCAVLQAGAGSLTSFLWPGEESRRASSARSPHQTQYQLCIEQVNLNLSDPASTQSSDQHQQWSTEDKLIQCHISNYQWVINCAWLKGSSNVNICCLWRNLWNPRVKWRLPATRTNNYQPEKHRETYKHDCMVRHEIINWNSMLCLRPILSCRQSNKLINKTWFLLLHLSTHFSQQLS